MRNSDKIILDLCGGTGAWSKPYADAGYDVRIITLPDIDIWLYSPPKNVHGILAAPPCTHFSYMRNSGRAKLPTSLFEGMQIVKRCLDIIWGCRYYPTHNKDNSLKFWALENPTGYLTQFLGKPALEFCPSDYGDPWTKKTCLWGCFNEPKKTPITPKYINPVGRNTLPKHVIDLPEGYILPEGVEKRKARRAITPPGFAKAFCEANK